MNIIATLLACAAVIAPALAGQPRTHPLPPDLVIEELRETYSQLFAEEVSVRYRGPQAPERTDTYVVRIDPGPDPERRPARLFLELGQLRILFADNQMLAINMVDPEHYVREPFDGLITPELVAQLLPPLPLPHLSLAAARNDMLQAPTPYTPDIIWTAAILDAETRPAVMRIAGAGSRGQATLLANADNIQLMRIAVQIRAGTAGNEAGQPRVGDAAMELVTRAIEPGDPATWTIDTAGRQRVASLTSLRPSARPAVLAIGQRVPDMGFSRTDSTAWSLYSALRAVERLAPPGQEPDPLALILIRIPADPDEAEQRLRTAAEALRALRRPNAEFPRTSEIAVAGIMTLTDFTRTRLDAARAAWINFSAPLRDELLSGHAPTQTIDRFDPGANTLLVLIAAEGALRQIIPLDGLTPGQLRDALRVPPPVPEVAPAPDESGQKDEPPSRDPPPSDDPPKENGPG